MTLDPRIHIDIDSHSLILTQGTDVITVPLGELDGLLARIRKKRWTPNKVAKHRIKLMQRRGASVEDLLNYASAVGRLVEDREGVMLYLQRRLDRQAKSPR